MELQSKPRRLRTVPAIRDMVRETRISAKSLIHPIFVREGAGIEEVIPSMFGQKRYSVDRLGYVTEDLLKSGVKAVILFGVPEQKDPLGTGAYAADGIVQRAIAEIKAKAPEMFVITDVCMCEYTSHGHCGILDGDYVHNEKTLPYLAEIALSHVLAGADMVAPSDMMDGRVAAIRRALDKNSFGAIPIMSYAVKYASGFYSPFREAAGSCPAFGDRKSYQMDYHNSREAEKEALLDFNEGADILMVKPALSYLDIVSKIRAVTNTPVAAYSVSGEYSMIKAAALAGVIDEYSIMCETAASIFRAGAGILCTYFSKEIASAIRKGDIG